MVVARFGQFALSFISPKVRARRIGLQLQRRHKPIEVEGSDRLLIHCASYGEYEQIVPLYNRIRKNDPNRSILFSFFSPSGYEMAIKTLPWETVLYLPMDTVGQMTQFIETYRPSCVYIVKYEIWPNFINQLSKRQIPIYLLSARFFPSQVYFKWYGTIFRKSIQKLTGVFVQDQASKTLIESINVAAVVTGDTRADRVVERAARQNDELQLLNQFPDGKPLMILGSVWPEDWAIFRPLLQEVSSTYRLLVAPHDVSSKHLEEIEEDCVNAIRWSAMNRENRVTSDVIVMDRVGLLADSYRYACIAYVGGGFKQGLHNILEPAAYGIPVIYGPQIRRFGEAIDLKTLGGGFSVSNSGELAEVLRLLSNEDKRKEAGRAARAYIDQSRGSTDRMYDILYNIASKSE